MDVREHLTKVLNDIIGNRKNLVGQIDAQQVQLDQNKFQLAHFDVVVASLKHQLSDTTGSVVTGIEHEMGKPDLHEPVVPPAPLAAAGVSEEPAGQASA